MFSLFVGVPNIHKSNFRDIEHREYQVVGFITDIAVILLYAIINFDNNQPDQRLTMLVRNFMTQFWKGYLAHNTLTEAEVSLIPDVMHLKSIFAFDHIQKVYARIAELNHVQEKYKGQLQSFWVESFSFLNINLIGY